MYVSGQEDAEGEIVSMVRGLVGPSAMLSASFDLHGNFSEQLAANLDMLSAYRTAPHVDEPETRLKALSMLLSCIRSGERPQISYIRVPLGISGEMSNTADEPGSV